MIKHLLTLFACAALLVMGGCTTTRIDQFRQAATGLKTDESIVILGRREKSNYETADTFVNCVASSVGAGHDGIKVIPEKEFLDALFPFFEPRTAPMRTANLKQLMDVEQARDRIKSYHIGYIVWVDGTTQRSGNTGGMTCSVGPSAAGCFGFGSWQDDSKFEAEVWDMTTLESVGSISTNANGQSYMPALIVPIPLIARVEASACSGLGNQLKQFIAGKSG
ncbi:MAG TPA: hypothetical protein VMH83_07135 [Candidatus Acidoferrum sp.]|nr:hypothetical protein [Candidatus Acidoferrum sp.]